jgi:hypothetical protein
LPSQVYWNPVFLAFSTLFSTHNYCISHSFYLSFCSADFLLVTNNTEKQHLYYTLKQIIVNMRRPRSPSTPQYISGQYGRKRQRRQQAASVVQSLWGENMGRKSTAQPRPDLQVPERGIGPIEEPNQHDVLCGRGGRINSHTGNIQFRDAIQSKKKEYLAKTTKKLEKAHIAASIVHAVRTMEPSGRFLKEDRDTGLWFDIGDAKAIKKAGQALREDAPDIRTELEVDEDDSSGEEKNDSSDDKIKTPEAEKPPVDSEKKVEAEEPATPDLKTLASPSPTKEKPETANSPPSRPPNQQVARQGFVSGRGAQHLPGRSGSYGHAGMTPQEYQAQAAMPPPYAQHAAAYGGQGQAAGVPLATQNIPIQRPQKGFYALPNQLYAGAISGARSVGRTVVSASRQARDALAQSPPPVGQYNPYPALPEDIAFGRNFTPLTGSGGTVLSSGNTMSTISGCSGISDPMSSGGVEPGMDPGQGVESIPNSRRLSYNQDRHSYNQERSLRLSQLQRMSQMGSSRLSYNPEHLSHTPLNSVGRNSNMMMSDVTMRSSLHRSSSFPEMGSITEGGSITADHPSWKAIMEGNEGDLNSEAMLSSSGSSNRQLSMGSRHSAEWGPGAQVRTASSVSAMSLSVASMSIGSGASFAGMGFPTGFADDGRSIFSDMSSDMHALDLAAANPRLS